MSSILRIISQSLFLMLVVISLVGGIAAQTSSPKESSSKLGFKVEIVGQGRPMILIPGLSCAGEVWQTTVAHYRKDYECHILTLAGFAGEAPMEGLSLERVQKDIAQYIRTNKLVKPVIVGHSLGGFTALRLASQEPDLVGAIVVVDSLPFLPALINPMATSENMRPLAASLRTSIAGQSPEQWRAFQQNSPILKSMIRDEDKIALATKWGIASDPKMVGEATYELYTTDIRPELAKIKVPTLVIGTWIGWQRQREEILANFQAQYASLPNCKIVMFDTAKHFVMFDEPAKLFAEMDTFLATKK